MSITANKVPGVSAAQCHDVYLAERARKSNNAQVLKVGALVIGPELAKTGLDAWLRSESRSSRAVVRHRRWRRWKR
jgi:ribose 5-phosphate isomerase B